MKVNTSFRSVRSSRVSRRRVSIEVIDEPTERASDSADGDNASLSVQKTAVSIFLSFVPNLLVSQLLKESWNANRRMRCTSQWCAAAFIDISGFSSLASELQSMDKNKGMGKTHISGAESLTIFLNNTLQRLIDVVADFEGDIVKFAGDAMIVLWKVDIIKGEENSISTEKKKAQAVAAACTCATNAIETLEVLGVIGENNADVGTSPMMTRSSLKKQAKLSVHTGIGCGNVTAFHVGGLRKRWEFFVMGSACNEMNFAESLANKGETVISKGSIELLKAHSQDLGISELKFGRKKNGYALLSTFKCMSTSKASKDKIMRLSRDIVTKLDNSLRSYIPAPIVSAVDEGENLSGDGVLRELCVLFIKLTSLKTDFDPLVGLERTAEHFQKSVVAIQEAAYHGRATLRQFLIDDKGAVAIVVVGLPPVTAVKNSSRGLKVALRILEKGVPAQIGVTTGTCYCGTIGSSFRGDFAVVGDHINMAARLMASADEGSVLCDTNTMRAACKDKSLCFSEPRKLRVKGKKMALAVYTPSRKIYSIMGEVDFLSTQKSPLVGNAEAWKDLHSCHERRNRFNMEAERVPSQVAIVAGRKLSGKTKTISFFQNMQKLERVPILAARADKFEDSTPFFVWRSILYNIFEHGRGGYYSHDLLSPELDQRGYNFEELFECSTAIADLSRDAEMNDVPSHGSEIDLLTTLRKKKNNRKFSAISVGRNASGSQSSPATKSPITPSARDNSRRTSAYSIMTQVDIAEEDEDGGTDNIDKESEMPLNLTTSHPIGRVAIIKHCVDGNKINAEHMCLLNLIMPSFNIPLSKVVADMSESNKLDCLSELILELLVATRELNTHISPIALTDRSPSTNSIASPSPSAMNGGKSTNSEVGDWENEPRRGSKEAILSDQDSDNPAEDSAVLSPNLSNYSRSGSSFFNHSDLGRLKPLSLFIDDFQNVDINSMRLLSKIWRSPKMDHCICVLTHNDEKNLLASVGKNFVGIDVTVTRLSPLTRTEISSVLYNEFSLSTIEDQIVEKIHITSGGYPGKAVNELQKLLDTDVLKIDNLTATCTLRQDPEVLQKFVSEDLEKQALEIFSTIDFKSKYIVQLSAITGQTVRYQLLEDMYVNLVGRSDGNDEEIRDEDSGAKKAAIGVHSRRLSFTDTESNEDFAYLRRTSLENNPEIAALNRKAVLVNRKKAFTSRIQDLIDAGVMEQTNLVRSKDRSLELSAIIFKAHGVSQIAYNLSLYSLREAAHKFVVEWYQNNCDQAELLENSWFLFNHCIRSMDFTTAAGYLYQSIANDLENNQPSDALESIEKAEDLFVGWSRQLLDQLGDMDDDAAATNARDDDSPLPITSNRETIEPERSPIPPRGSNRTISKSVFAKLSAELPALAGELKQEQREALRPVEYCRMRCMFFESLARVELSEFRIALSDLEIVMKFCKKEGAKIRLSVVERFCGWMRGRREPKNAQDTKGSFEKVVAGDNGDPTVVTSKMLNALYESSTTVYNVVKDIQTMQKRQQQMLREIAHNTHLKLADSGGSWVSSSSMVLENEASTRTLSLQNSRRAGSFNRKSRIKKAVIDSPTDRSERSYQLRDFSPLKSGRRHIVPLNK